MTNQEIKIRDMLLELGFEPNLRGYDFVVDAVLTVCNNRQSKHEILKKIYTEVGKKHGTTVSKTERNIRHSIYKAYRKDDPFWQMFMGGVKVKGHPANSVFISLMAERLNVGMKEAV